jgi:hypothetical protein
MFNVAKMLYYKFAGMDLERMEELLKLNPNDEKLKDAYERELEKRGLPYSKRINKLKQIYPHLSDTSLSRLEEILVSSEKNPTYRGSLGEMELAKLFSVISSREGHVRSALLWYRAGEKVDPKIIRGYHHKGVYSHPPTLVLKYKGPEKDILIPYIAPPDSGHENDFYLKKDNRDVLYYDPFKGKYVVGSVYKLVEDWIKENFEWVDYVEEDYRPQVQKDISPPKKDIPPPKDEDDGYW